MTPRLPLISIVAALGFIVALPAAQTEAQTAAQAAAPSSTASASAPVQNFTVPPHNCVAPSYPSKETTMQLRGEAYNRAIEKFNGDAKAYAECMQKYVADSKVWLKEVADAGNKAIEEYNKFNQEIREKIEADKQ